MSEDALSKMMTDLGANIHVNLNEAEFRMPPSARPIAVPAGATLAYFEPHALGTNPAEAITYLFIGNWRKTDDRQSVVGERKVGKPSASVHNMAIKIQAEQSRAQSLIKGLALKDMAAWCQ